MCGHVEIVYIVTVNRSNDDVAMCAIMNGAE